MCCLFGLMDCRGVLTAGQRAGALHALAAAAEARGTDATGIAYLSEGRLHVYKRPLPGHCLRFRLPRDTRVVMGHTRMTTQGSAGKNFNNHPFRARAGGKPFALAHNGMIHNDQDLRRAEGLPRTNIQTDSYVAVQLLERSGAVTSRGLGEMAEKLEGSFTFTVLDHDNSLYFVRGNNPICIYREPGQGLYLYASTREILDKAMGDMPFRLERREEVELASGEILKVDAGGEQSRAWFDDRRLWYSGWAPCSILFGGAVCSGSGSRQPGCRQAAAGDGYAEALRSVAGAFGCAPWEIDQLLQSGFTEEEIEDYLYCGYCGEL